MNPYNVIQQPLLTEKSVGLQTLNQYTFAVDPRATKRDVKRAVETIFKVKVIGVGTMNFYGKQKRVGRHIGKTSDWKKAIVTLPEGQKIEFGERT